MPAPGIINELVGCFDRNLEAYKQGHYSEAEIRLEYIDPFFKALGWDVYNEKGYAAAYKDIVPEDAIKVGGATKAPDYSFRIGGERKFFVEAKKPSVNLKDDISPSFQLRRYAWSAKLPLSILTDFEEFAVYDCQSKPARSDKASTSRVMYFEYQEYLDSWEEITTVFSREAVLKGSFDQYAESTRSKKGTAPVDTAFLKEIEVWREILARNIALRNPTLTQRVLNFSVQRTIDRIIFLRICEDRGIEPYGKLMALQNGTEVYQRLLTLLHQADDRYNSGLFHFKPEKRRPKASIDTLTPNLQIDDKVLKDILKNLYYPDSPYEFYVLPADILGQVYEQFLGKVIRLTPSHRAKVEDKPEVKKAGGVYYTPTYIVEYIVKRTVGKLLEGKKAGPRGSVSKLKILDPACGSGSFLIGAYQYILDWHLEQYIQDDPDKHARGRPPRLRQGRDGDWKLTIDEKKRILINNIYGVDIDAQAVEVTKLSLLLKVLEGESEGSMRQLEMFATRALPDLEDNIKCGNSLIGSDIYNIEQMSLLDNEEKLHINVFDWEVEFSEIMRAGGFDIVIGNPPWGGDIDREIEYFHEKYPETTKEHTDSFKLFINAGISLAREGGFVSMIVPNTLLRQRRITDVRILMLKNQINELIDLGEDVFEGVIAPSCVFVLAKGEPLMKHQVKMFNLFGASNIEKSEFLGKENQIGVLINQKDFEKHDDLEFMIPLKEVPASVTKLGTLIFLKCRDAGINYQRINVGMQEKGKSDLSKRLLYEGEKQKPDDVMYWKGSDINRYFIEEQTERFCRTNYKDFIRPNEVVRLNKEVFNTAPKILLRQTADHIIATIDYKGVWFGRSIISIIPIEETEYQIEYFLGLLNSSYFSWLYNEVVHEKGRVFAQVKLSKLNQLLIRTLDFSNPTDVAHHDKMGSLVKCMIDLHKQLFDAKTPQEKTILQRQIDATEKQIDELVYELYELTEEEIKIVEGGM
jgi:type I restriction-modification system DNA methylase subunit